VFSTAPAATCQHGDPACAAPADYVIAAVPPQRGRTRAFCAAHVEAGAADARRTAEVTGVAYEIEPLREGLPAVALWPSDRRAAVRLAVLAAVILLAIIGFAIIAPVMIRT